MKIFLTILLLTIFLPFNVIAEEVSVDEILGNNPVSEEEVINNGDRRENLENELNISIPDYTDNPSHTITFLDPSEDKVAVELDINEGGYKKITSPYSLPALTIGNHNLKFRFVDSFGATRVLEYSIVILPRPPILRAPRFEENDLIISGTGLANSEAVVTVSVNTTNFVVVEAIDGDGSWTATIPMETIPNGIYTVFAYTRRNGFASNPSEPAVMSVGDGIITKENDIESTGFSLDNISLADLPNMIIENTDLLLILIATFLIGALISAILVSILKRKPASKEEREIARKIKSEKKNSKQKEEKTLLELFGEEEKDTKSDDGEKKNATKKKTKKKGKNKDTKKEAVFSKKDFLKDFEKFDPDKDTGEEKSPPKEKDKKEVLVSLTSKVEEEE